MDKRTAIQIPAAIASYICRMKKIILLSLSLFALIACQQDNSIVENQAVGYAQGTTYQIKYITKGERDWQPAFDSIFNLIDQSMSTYLPGSRISRLNEGEQINLDPHFKKVWQLSKQIHQETGGAFDPTVGPVVKLWGFDEESPQKPDSITVTAALQQTGMKQLSETGGKLAFKNGGYLDFNAIAQGYTVDVLSRFLESREVDQYMVEVGGEVRCKGKNASGEIWKIGVDKPNEEIDEQDRFQFILALKNTALATSGNYRKFWVDKESGTRYAHTIDPKSGYPAKNQLLAVSVIAPTCAKADAYATACMVMGAEKAMQFLKNHPKLEGYLIIAGEDASWQVQQTEGFKQYVVD